MSQDVPQVSKGRAPKVIGAMVAAATLVGGVAATFQLRDYLWPKKPAEHSSQTDKTGASDGLRVVSGPAGAKVGLKEGWAVVDGRVMMAAVPGMAETLEQAGRPETVFFEGPLDQASGLHPFAMMICINKPMVGTLADARTALQKRFDCVFADIEDTSAGQALHAVYDSEMQTPDGELLPWRKDVWLWAGKDRQYTLMFGCTEGVYMGNGELFATMARSVSIP